MQTAPIWHKRLMQHSTARLQGTNCRQQCEFQARRCLIENLGGGRKVGEEIRGEQHVIFHKDQAPVLPAVKHLLHDEFVVVGDAVVHNCLLPAERATHSTQQSRNGTRIRTSARFRWHTCAEVMFKLDTHSSVPSLITGASDASTCGDTHLFWSCGGASSTCCKYLMRGVRLSARSRTPRWSPSWLMYSGNFLLPMHT